jgi:hypothetical protein
MNDDKALRIALLLASGATVVTYWSVFSSVLRA